MGEEQEGWMEVGMKCKSWEGNQSPKYLSTLPVGLGIIAGALAWLKTRVHEYLLEIRVYYGGPCGQIGAQVVTPA